MSENIKTLEEAFEFAKKYNLELAMAFLAEHYKILETINLLKNAQISKDDAIKFLKFGKETSEDSENLKTLRKGYEFAKKYKLKEAGKLILDHLEKLASLPKDVGGIIASY